MLVRYSPNGVAKEDWQRVRPFVLGVLEQFPQKSFGVLRSELGLLAHYTMDCVRKGLPLEYETILHPEPVEAYLTNFTGSLHSYRSFFTKWGRALTRDAPWRPVRQRDPKPSRPFDTYSSAETAQFWDMARRQSTVLRRRTAVSMISLCLGAGLRGDEFVWAQAGDIKKGQRAVVVNVGEPRPRMVPVRSDYASELYDLSRSLDPGEYLHGRKPEGYGVAYRMSVTLDGVRTDQVPIVRVLRLRNTWLRDLLEAGIPFGDVYRATGGFHAANLLATVPRLHQSSDEQYERTLASVNPRQETL